tara:strand:- start:8137 stop:9018 length:882 start_codon:yes stop_codon:yes gene_type:complete
MVIHGGGSLKQDAFGGRIMQQGRVVKASGLVLLMILSTVAAPASAQDTVQDPKQPSVDNPHMHVWGDSGLNNCWTHFDANDSAGSASEGYGEETFSQGQQVEVEFSCKMQENLKQDMYLDANGTITFEFVVAIYSADACDDAQNECTPLTFTLTKGSTEIAKQEFPNVNKDGGDEIIQWNLNTNETMARWNKSIEEPEIHVEFSWPGYNGIECIVFDCTGEFRFYYSNNENNDTVEVNFPVINQTIPGQGGGDGDEGGIGGAVSDALPGFGLVAGIGALALAAVGASRFSREE